MKGEAGIRDDLVTGVQTCALRIFRTRSGAAPNAAPTGHGTAGGGCGVWSGPRSGPEPAGRRVREVQEWNREHGARQAPDELMDSRLPAVIPKPASAQSVATQVMPRWTFWLAIGYAIALFAVAVAYLDKVSWLSWLPDPLGPIPLSVPWFGALGGMTIGLRGIFRHNQSWDPSYKYRHL